jgi:hypothetical protein
MLTLEEKAKTGQFIQTEISEKVFALKNHIPMIKGLDQLLNQKWVTLEDANLALTQMYLELLHTKDMIVEANNMLDFDKPMVKLPLKLQKEYSLVLNYNETKHLREILK